MFDFIFYRNLKKGKYYKILVAANKGGITVAVSEVIYVATAGGKVGNYSSVRVEGKKCTLKVGKSRKIKAKAVRKGKKVHKYRALAYDSDNRNVAVVDRKGKVTAVGPGTCRIYVYAQNGVYNTVQVRVNGKAKTIK